MWTRVIMVVDQGLLQEHGVGGNEEPLGAARLRRALLLLGGVSLHADAAGIVSETGGRTWAS